MVDTQKLVKERRKRERQALYRVIKEKIKIKEFNDAPNSVVNAQTV